MPMKPYVMTVMATNRVGILAALATALDELGGSFVDVSLAIMRQYFTVIAAVEFPEARESAVIIDHIRAVCRPFGGDVILKDPADELLLDESPPELPTGTKYYLRMAGEDRPGVLRKVSLRMAQEGIDITDLYGERDDAAGRFASCLELAVPSGADVVGVHRDLNATYAGQGVTFELYRDDVLQAITQPSPLRVDKPRRSTRVG
jgi:glycine cleavage system transcriptional repressor